MFIVFLLPDPVAIWQSLQFCFLTEIILKAAFYPPPPQGVNNKDICLHISIPSQLMQLSPHSFDTQFLKFSCYQLSYTKTPEKKPWPIMRMCSISFTFKQHETSSLLGGILLGFTSIFFHPFLFQFQLFPILYNVLLLVLSPQIKFFKLISWVQEVEISNQ